MLLSIGKTGKRADAHRNTQNRMGYLKTQKTHPDLQKPKKAKDEGQGQRTRTKDKDKGQGQGQESAPDLAAVMSAYLDKINPNASQTSLEELKAYTESMGAAVCLRAIDAALDAGKASWNYIRAILRTKQSQGVRCLADWDRLEAHRQRPADGMPDYSHTEDESL